MSVKIFPETKVFIACPANSATGGPELLHQLGYNFINDLNVNAFMYYYNYDKSTFKTPVHPEYEMYKVPYVLDIEEKDDCERNILIVPETIETLLLFLKYKKIRKGVWFLSVDNYYFHYYFYDNRIKKRSFFSNLYIEYKLEKLFKIYNYKNDNLLKLADFYMTNSYRGMNWFRDLTPLYYLSEYLNPEFLKTQTDLSKKENMVTYNPKKGLHFTKKIIKSAKDIKFAPLINMSREEVIEILQRTKVYIDFGNHPGKDRLPREAAILGCCVITGKRGSAAFFEDVPILDEYKFEDKEENIPKIVEKIKDCFINFEERYKDFEYYRHVIKNEPRKFIEDLRKIFC